MSIDPLWFSTSRIAKMRGGNDLAATATGFFYRAHDRRFLITNYHVVTKDSPDTLRISVHLDPKTPFRTLRSNEDLLVPLYDADGRKLWLEHPKHGRDVDIVALGLERILYARHYVKCIQSSNFIPDTLGIGMGEDVIALGYPLGFYDKVNNFPVLRSGVVASPYPVPFMGVAIFLVDARFHEGMSGGPVLTKPKQDFLGKNGQPYTLLGPTSPRFFLGVLSHAFPPNLPPNPLAVNVVWYPNLVEEIASQ